MAKLAGYVWGINSFDARQGANGVMPPVTKVTIRVQSIDGVTVKETLAELSLAPDQAKALVEKGLAPNAAVMFEATKQALAGCRTREIPAKDNYPARTAYQVKHLDGSLEIIRGRKSFEVVATEDPQAHAFAAPLNRATGLVESLKEAASGILGKVFGQ